MSTTPRLILASTSPFRHALLARFGLDFAAIAPDCDETPLAGETAAATAQRLARDKAKSLAHAYPQALIIGSDQVALLEGQQLGKPGTHEKAVAMLQAMRGQTVAFHTALCLFNSATGHSQEMVDITRVVMRDYSDAQIAAYLAREPDALRCAGAAKSEGLGGALIERIESTDPNALIGFPVFALIGFLAAEGLEVL